MSIRMEVWGENACFTRPEMKTERVTYDVMTPSAARGILEAVYWHPGMRWHIDKIHVLSPIRFVNLRRNEVKSKVQSQNALTVMNGGRKELYLSTSEDIQQRASVILQDVHYIIEAHFTLTERAVPGDNAGKFQSIIKRRLEKGQCYHQPCFGVREFPAQFRLWPGGEIPTTGETRDMGLMLYDMDYSDLRNITPMFFRAALENGVLNVPAPESPEVLR